MDPARRLRLRRLTVAVAMAAGTVLYPASGAGAQASYAVVAGADLVRITVTPDPPAVTDAPFDFGGHVAEARLDSTGASTAHASAVFPGALFIDRPSPMAALTGGLLELPRYPLDVRSTYPSQPNSKDEVSASGVTLDASSGPFYSRGYVLDGNEKAEAEVLVNPVDDIVRGQSQVSLGIVEIRIPPADLFGGALLIAKGLRTVARVVRAPGGVLERSSRISVGELVVLGRPVTLPGGGLEALDTHPVVRDLAEKHGVELSYLGPTETEHGMISAALSVSWRAQLPGYGEARVTALLGRTYASVTNDLVDLDDPD